MSHSDTAWRVFAEGVILHIILTPKSSSDLVGDVVTVPSGEVLRVKVRAVPDKGQANQALIKLLSKWLGVSKSTLELSSGSRSRLKSVKIYGNSAKILKVLERQVLPRQTST